MDWTRAIEINREALTRIVAALVALLAAQGGAKRLALPVYQLIARVLVPAESAVRRLIVMMARGLVVPVGVSRTMPKGLVIAGSRSRGSFQLFDTRKQFNDHEDSEPITGPIMGPIMGPITGPRIRIVDDQAPREMFLAKFQRPDVIGEVQTALVTRRLAILKRTLDSLPRQAKRMARWRAKRAMMQSPKVTSPLRPGPPPGARHRRRDDIDEVLTECHALAWDALSFNTS